MTETDDLDEADVLAANRAFYEAFERRDFDALSDCWEHSDRVRCTHPGWPTLSGWGAVAAAWMRLVSNTERLQFILTNERVGVEGSTAWVSVDENIIGAADSSTVAALNIFVKTGQAWKLVVHHGSVVHASLR